MNIKLLIFFFLLYAVGYGQDNRFTDSILDHHLIKLPVYTVSDIGNDYMVLKMNYSKSDFTDTTGIHLLNHAQILSIDLVFTDYPNNDELRQLNINRLKSLQRLLPFSLQQHDIRWQVIRQMNGKDKQSSQDMLHGFVINYRKADSKIETDVELKRIDDFIKKESANTAPPVNAQKRSNWAIIHQTGGSTQKVFYGRFMKKIADYPDSLLKDKRVGDSIIPVTVQQALQRRLILPQYKRDKKDSDTLYVLLEKPEPPLASITEKPLMKEDSSVLKTLQKIAFKKTLVVADVTGSMSPWLLQLLEYLSDHEKKNEIQYFSCFNDGDNLADAQKQIGRTGGVYTERFKTTLDAAELISMAMQRGRGGDLPENVCEGIITASKEAAGYDNIVLLADRWAPVRDIELVNQISKPVHIVACGNRLGIHPDYITIALKTNGSIHFTDEDITDFTSLKQGKEMTIKNKVYVLRENVVEVR
ncbi:MAG: hypothetical protein JWN76_106 [Chitinophagaceae bacterium]|nr:hypothetical protein [Chitinophagaceae bacterium]